MCKFYLLFLLLVKLFQNTCSDKHDGLLQALTSFMIRRNVQTVTAHYTCWPSDSDNKLLDKLSSNGVSVCFCPFVMQTQINAIWYRHAFIIDLLCEESKNILRQITNTDDRFFNTQNDWILLGENPMKNETNSASFTLKMFETYLGNAYVLPDSGVFLFLKINDDKWEIWSGFRASESDAFRVFKIGAASSNGYTVIDSYVERRNFHGVILKANTVIVERELFLGFDKKSSSDLDIFSHIHYVMINILSQQLNFKLDLGFSNEYGWSSGNGTFSGLIGLLQKNEIDLSAAAVIMRTDRMAVVDYTIGTMSFRTTALFRQPSLSSVNNILLLPFSVELWLMILLIFLIFIFIIILLTRTNNKLQNQSEYSMTIQDIITLVQGAICQQGINFKSNLEASRVVVFVLFLTFLFLYNSYSANIAALIQLQGNSIKSIQDLVESPMTFSAQISPYGKYYFEESNDSLIKTLYNRKMISKWNNGFTKSPEGIEKIRTGFHGFMSEVISAYNIIGKEWQELEKCGLSEIELFRFPPLSIPLVKRSGHKDLFKQKLIQQMEVGLSKRTINQWMAPKPSCGSSTRSQMYVSVSIKDINITLKVLGMGVCISLGTFLLEFIHYFWEKRIIFKDRINRKHFIRKMFVRRN